MKKLIIICSVFTFIFLCLSPVLEVKAALPRRLAATKVTATALRSLPAVNDTTVNLASPLFNNIDFISQALLKQKSVQVVEQGPPGMLSNLFIRGSKSVHNAVVIDGVQMNSASDGGYDFSQMLIDDYDTVVIAPNPSYLNQSHATGGTVLLTTKQGRSQPTAIATIEQGTYPSQKINVQTQGNHHHHDIFLSATHFQSGSGIRSSAHSNMIADKYHLQTLSANIGLQINPKFSLRTITHWQSSKLRLNEYQGALPYFTDNNQKTAKYDATIKLMYDLSHDIKHQLYMTQAKKNLSFTDGIASKIVNQQNMLSYQFNWQMAKNIDLEVLFENRIEHYKPAGQLRMNDRSKFINAGIQGQYGARLAYQLSLRYHQLYNDKTYYTYQSTAQYSVTDNVKFKTGYGTGIRAPKMAERYGNLPYQLANQYLQPEKSRNFDIGIQSQYFSKRLSLDISLFHNIIDNFITFTAVQPNIYQNFNSQKRMSRGAELFAVWMLGTKTKIQFNYTYIDARDSQIQGYPLRLARHKFSSDIVYSPTVHYDVYAGLFYKSSQNDKIFSNNSYVCLKGYMTLSSGFIYKINDHFELTGRIDNMLNHHYENVYGFSSNGTVSLLTLKAKL